MRADSDLFARAGARRAYSRRYRANYKCHLVANWRFGMSGWRVLAAWMRQQVASLATDVGGNRSRP